ncbi:MAG: magnesium/cobalt transporter CorA [Deltaproteobacteria bacterium]|uniref:Magnesium transport protein CorA n=1 Tax=Candidatus Zymogenus saltonus TaxID=2844893 RepID=A0A9D8PP73_9DELT|nr:magnesium/cobalt transporter CorA [Candidatus Zymogenus saltonus]
MQRMSNILKKVAHKSGSPPGSLIHTGEKKVERTKISIIDYDKDDYSILDDTTIEECFKYRDKPTTTWINVSGLHDENIMEELSDRFRFHSLTLEDVMNTGQRVKLEDFEDHTLIIIKAIYFSGDGDEIIEEQLSLIFGKGFVVTFQENNYDPLSPLIDRIKSNKGFIRKMGADYLTYSIIDTVVDGYYLILQGIAEKVEYLERELIRNPDMNILNEINRLKIDTSLLYKSIWPLRAILSKFEAGGAKYISKSTAVFIRDVYDHTLQILEITQSFSEMLTGMMEIYMSSVSNKMNEIMKVLTIIATIFMPLSFIAGIYGMNFEYMPELKCKLGYFSVWGVCILVALGMLRYFRKKGWI